MDETILLIDKATGEVMFEVKPSQELSWLVHCAATAWLMWGVPIDPRNLRFSIG